MIWFWLALAIGLLVVEVVTSKFVAVWFATGAGVLAIVELIANDLAIYWQLIIFVVLSVLLLIATRPLVKRILKGNKNSQNEKDDE